MKYNNSDRFAVVLACLAGVMAIILFLVEKTRGTVVTLLVLMVALPVYPIMHFVKRLTGRIVSLLLAAVGTAAFGSFVWPPREVVKNNQSIVTRQRDIEKQLAPESLVTDAHVSTVVKKSRVKKPRETVVAAQSCPNGVCIGGDNNGSVTVNNSRPKLPNLTWSFDPRAAKPDAERPQQCVLIHIDRTFLDAKFAVICDRECKAIAGHAEGGSGGYFQSSWGTIPRHPEVAAFVVNGPNPMSADNSYKACVESADALPIKVIAVKTLTIDPDATP